jgi:hypothetical protein
MARPRDFVATLGGSLIAGGAASLIVSQVTRPGHPTTSDWFVVSVMFLAAGALLTVGSVVAFGLDLVRRQRTPFEVEYDPTDDQCVQDGRPAEGIQYRVKVRNAGRVGLIHVRARADLDGGHAHWLRIRHDNTEPYDRSLDGEILPAREHFWLYFDVVLLYVGLPSFGSQPQPNPASGVEFADPSLRSRAISRDSERLLTLTIWGTREDDGTTVKEYSTRCLFVNNGPDDSGLTLGVKDAGRA